MRADVPVGVLLSGGLDSRTVALYAREYTAGRLRTFSVGFGNADSELSEAEASSRMLGTVHHSINVGQEQYAESLERVAWHLDEPVGDPAALAVLKVRELARSEVKVLLSGEGADELFAGYAGRYLGMLRTSERSQRLRWLRFLLPPVTARGRSRWSRLLRRVRESRAAEIIRLRIEGLPGDIRNPFGLTDAQLRRLHRRAAQFGDTHYREQRDALSGMLALDTRWQLAESLLQKADKMSMAASIELRTPFLDKAVAECAGSIGSSVKLGADGRGKVVLRSCVERRLPGSAALPKKGFPVPLREWFTGPLRHRIEEEVLRPGSACTEQLDIRLLQTAWKEYLRGAWDGSAVFYALWLYELWRSAKPAGSRSSTLIGSINRKQHSTTMAQSG
jgi:asparagine synthase (glutamine-hydrolysing)